MKTKAALFALMAVFPLLYVSGAILRSEVAATCALLLVAAVCGLLLWPDTKA